MSSEPDIDRIVEVVAEVDGRNGIEVDDSGRSARIDRQSCLLRVRGSIIDAQDMEPEGHNPVDGGDGTDSGGEIVEAGDPGGDVGTCEGEGRGVSSTQLGLEEGFVWRKPQHGRDPLRQVTVGDDSGVGGAIGPDGGWMLGRPGADLLSKSAVRGNQ